MSWPVNREKVKKELLENFPFLNAGGAIDPHLDDFATIGNVLGSPSHVGYALSLIEKDLTTTVFGYETASKFDEARVKSHVVAAKVGKAREYYDGWQDRLNRSKLMEPALRDEEFAHLVTKEFGALEAQGGFWTSSLDDDNAPTDPPYKVMLMTPLSGKTFLKNLTHGRPWKDIVGPNHGEYTHRLQWCILIRGRHINEPAKAFRHIGELLSIYMNEKFSFTVWDALFDRIKPGNRDFPNNWPFWAEDKLDFRCPEVLLDWLCLPDQQRKYPLLAGFLKARKEKRLFQQQGFRASNFAAEYLSRKVYGQEFDTLSRPDKERIWDYLDDAAGRTGDPRQSAEKQIGLLEPTAGGYQHPNLVRK